ncbi:MAG: LacI family DNA-binding transcriptional regulator [Clostridia bacterium]|nr:LacI family DNA-binding transcriptional regulator [Clostridia bacterium]
MSVTIKDVAAAAGVSPATVSYVLNGTNRVGVDTRDNVLKVIAELGYEPNVLAQALATQRTDAIGIVIPHTASYIFSDPYFSELLRGIGDTLAPSGHVILLSTATTEAETESAYSKMFKGKRADGLLLICSRLDDAYVSELSKVRFPFVLVGRPRAGLDVFSVDIDNTAGGYEITRHLIGHGYDRIGMIAGPPAYANSVDRLQGYRRALKEASIDYSEGLVAQGDYTHRGGYTAMQALLANGRAVRAVFAASDLMAMGAIMALRDAGLRAPEDVAVMGFDDASLAGQTDPPISTVHQPVYELGTHATRMLLSLISGEEPQKRSEILDTSLVLRRSCGCNDGR